MRVSASIAAGALLILVVGTAAAQERIRLGSYYYRNHLLFCFSVPMSRVIELPTWNGKDNPPLSRERAAEAGARQLRTEYPSIDRFELQREELNRLRVDYTTFRGDVW